ncbi:HAD family hydrolase [Bacillus sp. BHET2]|uniref:HAD family hydrolase n=1 Tax=Bacillus sp. BHET2 TaxID=2583818 RepID=UPI00110D4385|nr:HAD family hydrolase [Bacillus sp. BHET2]TMU87484.1 HAD family hydrolase [Bacillus sp. BHET2]
MSRYGLLLFDLDETLLDSMWFREGLLRTLHHHPLTKELDALLFLERKLNVPHTILERFVNRELSPTEFIRARWLSAFLHFDIKPDIETIDEINDMFIKTGMKCIEEDDSLIRLLEELNEKYELGIVTNALYDPYEKIFQMGLSQIFHKRTIIHAEELGYRKPDKEIFTTALEAFGKKAEETIFIGDSWIHDVLAPMQYGMDAIWLNRKGIDKPSPHKPYAIISDIRELRDILI